MNPDNESRPSGREPKDSTAAADGRSQKTPSTDMQAEDAGTADSGATAAEAAMKQTSKTDSENGRQR